MKIRLAVTICDEVPKEFDEATLRILGSSKVCEI